MIKNPVVSFFSQKGIWITLIFIHLLVGKVNAQNRVYYQLKIYKVSNEMQEKRMDTYLEKAFLPALHRANIAKAGVFKPNELDTISGQQIIVLIPFKTLEQFDKLPELINNDKQYIEDGKDYINAKYDNPPYRRVESILLKAFKDMPGPETPALDVQHSERVYELRSYQGATEAIYQRKVEMFNEGGEINLFKKLGFNPIFFGEVISGGTMPNLMYMTSFSNPASQKEHWNAFVNHPDWNAMKDIEKYKNTVSNIEVFMLHPTDYSDF